MPDCVRPSPRSHHNAMQPASIIAREIFNSVCASACRESCNMTPCVVNGIIAREMASNRNFESDRAKEFAQSFVWATEVIVNNVKKPFRPRGLLNAATMEAVMVSLMEQGGDAELTKKNYDKLLKDQDFLGMVTSNTSNIENVKSRKAIADKILFGYE